jgi:two-component system sensor histidine kinase VicK
MTTLHMLTARTTAALGRLASLQKRAEKAAATAPVVRTALKELSETLEELQVANEHLYQQVDQGNSLKARIREEDARAREFVEALPVPCVWTTEEGTILEANPAAADLLNVSAQHLTGRPLVLFTVERARFSECLTSLNDGRTAVVELPAVLRPRERRPRPVRLIGRRLDHDSRRCWFILETPDAALTQPS